MDNKPKIPTNCFFQGCYNPQYEIEIQKAKEMCFQYNKLSPNDKKSQQIIIKKL